MRPLLAAIVGPAFLAAAACGHADPTPPLPAPVPVVAPPLDAAALDAPTPMPTAPMPGTLSAPVSVRSSIELKAQLTITNPGPGDLTFRRGALELSMLALEVRDAAGTRIPTVPPPVPYPADAEVVTVRPGASLVRDYGLHIYSPELPAGTYTLHCRVVACAPVTFTVAP